MIVNGLQFLLASLTKYLVSTSEKMGKFCVGREEVRNNA